MRSFGSLYTIKRYFIVASVVHQGAMLVFRHENTSKTPDLAGDTERINRTVIL